MGGETKLASHIYLIIIRIINVYHILQNRNMLWSITTITSAATLDEGAFVNFIDGSGGSFDVALPPASSTAAGTVFMIKRIDTNNGSTINVVPDGTDMIDGVASSNGLGINGSVTLVLQDSSNWFTCFSM